MRRGFLAAAVVIGTLSASFAMAVPASAGAIVVAPGESIYEAVLAAQPGDTIQLQAGVYEDVVSIKTNGITIQGAGSGADGTILHPPAELPGRCFGGAAGICVLGSRTTGTPVEGVTVTGVRAEGFAAFGLVAFLASGTTFESNASVDNGEYGIAAFESSGTSMLNNEVSGNAEAGLYVGDSPHARATLTGNLVHDNGQFGIFLRDSRHGTVSGNTVTGNCLGIGVLETPSPVHPGAYLIADNTISDNTAFCPGSAEEGSPPITGIGVGIIGGRKVTVTGNTIEGNRASERRPVPRRRRPDLARRRGADREHRHRQHARPEPAERLLGRIGIGQRGRGQRLHARLLAVLVALTVGPPPGGPTAVPGRPGRLAILGRARAGSRGK